ncbi:hypothetical protein [Agromyces sp. LHK192]|uniref:hypothetical protein n=1 Tax=Agromyces sp. LHK192 TaxID=2498704 RepID=UPI000FDC92D9|nr:hypothetical protein [Agromyces sp. LHK192]
MTDAPSPAPAGYQALVDRDRVDSGRRWNRALIVAGCLVALLAALGVVALVGVGFGSWFTVGLVALLGVMGLGLAVTSVKRGRMLRLIAGDGPVALAITDRGVALADAPEIPWSDLVLVGVLDDRRRTGRLRTVPVLGWFGSAVMKAGSGAILCELGVLDGEAYRAAFADRRLAKRVGLYGRWPDGRRRGLLPLLLDPVMSADDVQAVVRSLSVQATSRGIPNSLHESAFAFVKWKGPLLDPGWPVGG